MINVILNRPGFEYDIHSLVKAFYPDREVKVSVEADTFSVPGEDGDFSNTSDIEIVSEIGHNETDPGDRHLKSIYIKWGSDSLSVVIPHIDREEVRSVPLGDRLDSKNLVKRALYRLLSRVEGRELPWGALTGIRPTRLAMDRLSEGCGREETVTHMREMYYATAPKAELCVDIAERERAILKTRPYEEGYSLYVGIPFCPTTCMYCSFASYNIGSFKDQVEKYLEYLFRELEQGAKLLPDRILYSLYMGGGTPTSLSAGELDRLLSRIEECFDLSHLVEYTVEAGRPDSITPEKLQVLKAHRVSRISVNPQTMNPGTLELIGRRHTPEDTVRAFNMAREAGFENINMDIILGLPGEGEAEISATMAEISRLRPDSLTIHSLAVKRASALAGVVAERGMEGLNNSSELMDMAVGVTADMGLYPYYMYRQKNMTGNLENVGFAREGCYGIYNILMMEEIHPILACGAGTISKRIFPGGRIERSENVKDLKNYFERFQEMLERKAALFAGTHW